MFAKLLDIEKQLPELLEERAAWQSMDVNYVPPRVERLWRQVDDIRICLHRIHPCEKALIHPHPWPSAVRVIQGSYEMVVGTGNMEQLANTQGNFSVAKFILAPGSAYEMVEENSWHNVKPLNESSYSLMIMGPKYREADRIDHTRYGQGKSFKTLEQSAIDELLDFFGKHYC